MKFLCWVVNKVGNSCVVRMNPASDSAAPRGIAIFARRPIWAISLSAHMSRQPHLYDLVLLLSLSADDDARAKIVADVEAAIASAGGTLSLNQAWGRRPTTFRIDHESEADYHLLQFSGPTSLLESLSHSLHIADEVLRFRIIKVIPGTPPAPESAPPVLAGALSTAPPGDAELIER